MVWLRMEFQATQSIETERPNTFVLSKLNFSWGAESGENCFLNISREKNDFSSAPWVAQRGWDLDALVPIVGHGMCKIEVPEEKIEKLALLKLSKEA